MHLRGIDIRIELNPGTPRAQTLLHIRNGTSTGRTRTTSNSRSTPTRETRSASPAASTTRAARSRSWAESGSRRGTCSGVRERPTRCASGCFRSRLARMLDARVRAVLERLEREDAEERERGLPASERSRQVAATTGRFLFALVAPQADCEVLEIGGSRGYSTIWLAAGVRHLGGRVLSLEADPRKIEAWRATSPRRARGVGRARRGRRARDAARRSRTCSTSSSSTRRRTTTRRCSRSRADKVEPGALVRGRQRPLPRRPARALLGRPAGRPDARSR